MKQFFIGLGLLFALACAFVFMFVEDVDVTLSESQVQQAVNEQIDKGAVKSRGVELTLNSAIIDFKANNTAAINVDFDAEGFGYAGKMRGDFATGIRYNQPKLYLADLQSNGIETVLEEESASKVEDYKNVAKDFLKREKDKMLSDEAKDSLGAIVARNEETIKDYAVAATYKFFETLPIYDLTNAGVAGSLASLALKDVRFTEDSAVVTLSPRLFIIKVLSFIASLIAFALYLFFRYGRGIDYVINKIDGGKGSSS